MDTPDHIAHLERFAGQMADRLDAVAAKSELGTRVTTCPDWSVRDLAEHVGGIYRWATHLVAHVVGEELWRAKLPIEYPATDGEVGPWFRAGITPMVSAFGHARPDARVFVWGADPHARFWPRRMLHETTVHLADLQLTIGESPHIPAEVAIDGIDEFLTNLPCTARWGAPLDTLRAAKQQIVLRATDAAANWRIRLSPTGVWWDRGEGDGDATLSGPVADLHLHLQGRHRASVTVAGDGELIERWQAATAF